MSVKSVAEHLKKYDMDQRIITLNTTIATVDDAAKALNTEPARIAKTLSFKLKDKYILVVAKGSTKIDNAKYKNTFGEKARMLHLDEVEEAIGHPVGGVCPFGVKEGVEIYLDVSLKAFETIYPACGAINNAIELSIPELERITGYKSWVDVCKDREE